MVRLLGWCLLAVAVSATTPPKPHVLFVLVDDLGWGNVGFNRAARDRTPEVHTPNLDGLVAEGVHLTRHYVHQYCTPTRTSVQSGRLPVHVNTGLGSPCDDNTGISQNMTGMAEKMKLAGYTTAMAGKWDAGMATPAHTPHGRGYDSSLNYFSHKNDFWSQANMQTCCESDQTIIDFWRTDHGASDVNNTDYSEFLYQRELVGIIEQHDAATPLFLFYAPHVAHCPLQVPKDNYDRFGFMTNDEHKCRAQTVNGTHTIDPHHPELEYKCRQQYHAMVDVMDEVVGNITAAMKAKQMWDNTLVVMSSDNGGPVDLQENAANNWPMRGGKYSLFEGGIRVSAFMSGGFLPATLRGTVQNGMIHIADWYSTFSHLAGVDPTDSRAATSGLPPIDSINMWPFLSGAVGASPRTFIPIGPQCLVQGDYKLISQKTSPDGWQGPFYPNSSSVVAESDAWIVNSWADAPPRPYPRLAPCDVKMATQQWGPLSDTGNTICSTADQFGSVPCWNLQGGSGANQKDNARNVILWGHASTTNEVFALTKDGTITSPAGPTGSCVGASTEDESGLKLFPGCTSTLPGAVLKGWKYDAGTAQIQIVTPSGTMCVTADANGTHPTPTPPGPPSGGPVYLFNVVADPTEQKNLVDDPEYAALIKNMTAVLTVERSKFFSNNDKFQDDCPPDFAETSNDTADCACWMAKNKYGGFMGPFAMLGDN